MSDNKTQEILKSLSKQIEKQTATEMAIGCIVSAILKNSSNRRNIELDMEANLLQAQILLLQNNLTSMGMALSEVHKNILTASQASNDLSAASQSTKR